MLSEPFDRQNQLLVSQGKRETTEQGSTFYKPEERPAPLVIGPPFLLVEEEEEVDERCTISVLKTSRLESNNQPSSSKNSSQNNVKNDKQYNPVVVSKQQQQQQQPETHFTPDHQLKKVSSDGVQNDQLEAKSKNPSGQIVCDKNDICIVPSSTNLKPSWRDLLQDSMKLSHHDISMSRFGLSSNETTAHVYYQHYKFPPAYRFRRLRERLKGVIMGCTNQTKDECLNELVFGLPAMHWDYIKNVEHGTTVYLFNYSKRCLHGIFKAVGRGQWKIKPYGWSNCPTVATRFPAQVRVEVVDEYPCLYEEEYKAILKQRNSYITFKKMSFELDFYQVQALNDLFAKARCSKSNLDEPPLPSLWQKAFEPRLVCKISDNENIQLGNKGPKECISLKDYQTSNIDASLQEKPKTKSAAPHPLAKPSSMN